MGKRDVAIEKVRAVIAAPSCCADLKMAAQNYLNALDTVNEKAAAKKLVAELEEDVQSIDDVLAFFSSAEGKKVFGSTIATTLTEQAKKVKAKGGKFCFCPACTAGKELLDMKEFIL